jgi:hypothetical protein
MTKIEAEDDLLEQYLKQTVDLREQPALVREGRRWRTLDGTPHVPLRELARRTGRDLTDLQADFDAGRIMGVRIGNERFARQKVQKRRSVAKSPT